MKHLIYIIIFSIIVISDVYGLNLDVRSYVFYGEKSYIETYLRVDGNSVQFQDQSGVQTAQVEFLLMLKKGDDILYAEKFILHGSATDSLNDFMDVKRFLVPAGSFTLYVLAADKADINNKIELEQSIHVSEKKESIYLSDVCLLAAARQDSSTSSLVKNGIYMEPMSYAFAPEEMDFMYFYCEVYNGDLFTDQEYYLQYSLTETTSKNLQKKTVFTKYKKLKHLKSEPILMPLSLKEIVSGNYDFSVAVVNRKREVLFEKTTGFTRSNPTADLAYAESMGTDFERSFVHSLRDADLDYILKAHVPVAEQAQMATLDDVIKKGKPRSQRHYIHQYWQKNVKENHEGAFKQYMEVAKVVDKQFYSNVGYGFQTDRGYIFLKYGKPNNVLTIDNEPDAPPYEIWYYNYIPTTQQTNIRFLFWNPSLVHNDFRLLHSNCYSERNNPQWEVDLYRSVPMERIGNATDARQVGENFNRQARRYFNDY